MLRLLWITLKERERERLNFCDYTRANNYPGNQDEWNMATHKNCCGSIFLVVIEKVVPFL